MDGKRKRKGGSHQQATSVFHKACYDESSNTQMKHPNNNILRWVGWGWVPKRNMCLWVWGGVIKGEAELPWRKAEVWVVEYVRHKAKDDPIVAHRNGHKPVVVPRSVLIDRSIN
jgi:hypothetical protein